MRGSAYAWQAWKLKRQSIGQNRCKDANLFPMKTNLNSGLAEANIRSETQIMNTSPTASAGETFWVVGHRVTIFPVGNEYGYVDVFSPWQTPGPPPHRHRDCSEFFHVLEGLVDFDVGDERLRLGPGESVLVPRNAVHTFKAASESGSRVITTFAPGGFVRWFRDMGVPVDEPNARELTRQRSWSPLPLPSLCPLWLDVWLEQNFGRSKSKFESPRSKAYQFMINDL
jgi:mannose-6-phosphate isomerase-like protein (cupin superfamily)